MTFIDMFCGMGTIRMGFEQAGHKCVYSIEWDKHKRRIYEVLFGHEPEGRDITDIRADDLPSADCWTFGAPCQDFSIAGLRDGLDGDRSSLVREVFRLVRETKKEHRPEWLLYENVKGMLSSNKGLDYLEILFEMASLGYDIEYCLVNSKDNGVPQNRERVYTLGHLRTRGERKVFPSGGQGNEYSTVGKSAKAAVARTLTGGGHSGGNHSGMTVLTINTKDADGKEPPQQDRVYSTGGLMTALSAQLSGRYNIVEPMIQVVGKVNSSQDGFVLSPDGISKTLTSGHFNTPKIMEPAGVYYKVSPEYVRPPLKGLSRCLKSETHDAAVILGSRIRRLTPRECMRLQGVPDYITDKLIAAGISDTQLYRAAGDACTVNVVYEIAKAMTERGIVDA